MLEYKNLLQYAENLPRDLMKHSAPKAFFSIGFCSCFSSVDETEMKYARLVEKTARVLAYYPAPTKGIKLLILQAIILYVWRDYESKSWSLFSSPFVGCLQKALEIDSPSKLSHVQLQGYFSALEKFSHWVFSQREKADDIELLYAAFPHEMQRKFQEIKYF